MEVHSVKKSYGLFFFFFFFSIFLKKIKVDKGLVKFFKFLSLYFSLSLCFEGLLHPCGCKLPLIFRSCGLRHHLRDLPHLRARQRKCILFSKWSKAKEYSA